MTVAYSVLNAAIEANLTQGFSVIVSATYSRFSTREFLKNAVMSGDGTLKFILCTYNDSVDEVKRRVSDRIKSGAMGGCRSADHYFKDKERYDHIKMPHLEVVMDNGKDGIDQAISRALDYLSS